ncbi:hypothetical protein LINGRAHAP2_LOCUS36133 [Linum grandiflorum]
MNTRWKQRFLVLKRNSFSSTKHAILKLTSGVRSLKPKPGSPRSSRGRKQRGLVALHKDMESCGEYTDIQVMWEMLHSASSSRSPGRRRSGSRSSRKKVPGWRSCFGPV